MDFGLKDYFSMFKKRGVRLPIYYFFEAHLFDLLNGTDTHVWLPKEHYFDKPKNFDGGVLYMSSWTSIIKEATKNALDSFSLTPSDVAFVDVGCGKGKVLCVWSKMFSDAKKIVGIDYSEHLLKISRSNLEKISASEIEIICSDATEVGLNFGCKLGLFYLYNPFDAKTLNQFVKNLKKQDAVIVYNNPVHQNVFFDNGFILCAEKKSWHPNADYVVLSNIKRK